MVIVISILSFDSIMTLVFSVLRLRPAIHTGSGYFMHIIIIIIITDNEAYS